jgi:hypothetical protein
MIREMLVSTVDADRLVWWQKRTPSAHLSLSNSVDDNLLLIHSNIVVVSLPYSLWLGGDIGGAWGETSVHRVFLITRSSRSSYTPLPSDYILYAVLRFMLIPPNDLAGSHCSRHAQPI